MGEVEYRDLNGVELLAMEGSRVWIKFYDWLSISMPSRGWDLGPSGLSPLEESTMPPEQLYLSNTKLWDTGLCRILDTVTGKVVFQLPAQFGTPIDINGMDNIWLLVFSLGWSWFWSFILHFLRFVVNIVFFLCHSSSVYQISSCWIATPQLKVYN